jgi:hypothetical protein
MTRPKAHQGIDEITYQRPKIASTVEVHDVPIVRATDESLGGYGKLVDDPENFTVENGSFEIVPWPHAGWRSLDPGTGDEGGTTEGAFRLFWHDGNLFGENLALSTTANKYLLGLGALPSQSAEIHSPAEKSDLPSIDHVYVWYSDYHPDGGQMFYSRHSPFVANLAPALVAHAVNKVTLRVAVRVRIKACFACNGMPLSRNTTQSRARTAAPEGPQHNRFWTALRSLEWACHSLRTAPCKKRLCCG